MLRVETHVLKKKHTDFTMIVRKVFPNHMKWDSGCGLHPTKVCIE